MNQRIEQILDYWYGTPIDEVTVIKDRHQLWFGKSDAVDQEITELFATDVDKLVAGDYEQWLDIPQGRLASIILLDQFCRQIYRGSVQAFANDHLALKFCLDGIESGADMQLSRPHRYFFYLPLEHSENLIHQRQCVAAYQAMADECSDPMLKANYIDAKGYALAHLEIIERFGRFPHRNEVLGRVSTAQEIEFLKQPGSSF